MCVTRPVGTRGGCGAGRGPCACPGGNAIHLGISWSKMVAPQPGQAQGPLIHSTPPLVPTGRGRAFSIIPLFGRQNSLGERAHTPSTGRPSRPCKDTPYLSCPSPHHPPSPLRYCYIATIFSLR